MWIGPFPKVAFIPGQLKRQAELNGRVTSARPTSTERFPRAVKLQASAQQPGISVPFTRSGGASAHLSIKESEAPVFSKMSSTPRALSDRRFRRRL
jgi:hypothetical protein